jgi:uncharacterized protein
MKTNKQIVQDVYRFFEEGNVPAIQDLLADDIKWTCPGPTEILPYARVYNGKEQVADFFRLIGENKDFPQIRSERVY